MVCALARERFQKQYFIFAKIFLAFYSQAPKTLRTNTKHKIVFQPANVIEHHSGKIFVMPTALILTCSFWHLRCDKYSIAQNWWRTKVHNRCVCTMLLVGEFIYVRLLFEPAQQCRVNLEVSEIFISELSSPIRWNREFLMKVWFIATSKFFVLEKLFRTPW